MAETTTNVASGRVQTRGGDTLVPEGRSSCVNMRPQSQRDAADGGSPRVNLTRKMQTGEEIRLLARKALK